MGKSFRWHRGFSAIAFIIIFASCKKSPDSTQPPPVLPTITSFSPVTGSAGAIVTIIGKNFSSTIANDIVSFNGTVATVTSATVDQLIVTVPNGASTGKVTVKVSAYSVASVNDFTVLPLTATFSLARSGMAVASLGNNVYFGGGYDGARAIDNIDIYDVGLAKWTSAKLSQPRFNFAAASAGHKVVFAGGETDAVLPAPLSAVVDIYDDSTKTWSTASLSHPEYFLSAGAAGNKIVFGGGVADTGMSYNVDIYDVVKNTWSTHKLNDLRGYANIIGAGNKILVAGGIDGTNSNGTASYYKSVDVYDVITDSWSQTNLSKGRGGICAGASGNKIVFAGGYINDSVNTVLSSIVDVYDAVTGTWSTSQLAAGRSYSCAASAGNKILFSRDQDFVTGNISGIVDIYDVVSGTWSSSSLSEARIQMGAAGTGNKIVLAGGWTGPNGFSKAVDIYDVLTGVWSH